METVSSLSFSSNPAIFTKDADAWPPGEILLHPSRLSLNSILLFPSLLSLSTDDLYVMSGILKCLSYVDYVYVS
jgi:hypothetical protein